MRRGPRLTRSLEKRPGTDDRTSALRLLSCLYAERFAVDHDRERQAALGPKGKRPIRRKPSAGTRRKPCATSGVTTWRPRPARASSRSTARRGVAAVLVMRRGTFPPRDGDAARSVRTLAAGRSCLPPASDTPLTQSAGADAAAPQRGAGVPAEGGGARRQRDPRRAAPGPVVSAMPA